MLRLQRDCGRPPIPRKDPGIKVEEEPLLSNHPYVDKVFLLISGIARICDERCILNSRHGATSFLEVSQIQAVMYACIL